MWGSDVGLVVALARFARIFGFVGEGDLGTFWACGRRCALYVTHEEGSTDGPSDVVRSAACSFFCSYSWNRAHLFMLSPQLYGKPICSSLSRCPASVSPSTVY